MNRDPIPFPPLLASDSLVARLEQIWGLKPTVIEVNVGYGHPEDESAISWTTAQMTREQAAKALRIARREGLLIEASRTGYDISGRINWNTGPTYDAPCGGRL